MTFSPRIVKFDFQPYGIRNWVENRIPRFLPFNATIGKNCGCIDRLFVSILHPVKSTKSFNYVPCNQWLNLPNERNCRLSVIIMVTFHNAFCQQCSIKWMQILPEFSCCRYNGSTLNVLCNAALVLTLEIEYNLLMSEPWARGYRQSWAIFIYYWFPEMNIIAVVLSDDEAIIFCAPHDRQLYSRNLLQNSIVIWLHNSHQFTYIRSGYSRQVHFIRKIETKLP